MTVPEVTQWFQLVAAGGAALAVVWAATKYLQRRVVRPVVLRLDALLRMLDNLPAIERIVAKELTPNGGESLKDQVTRLEHSTTKHFARLEAKDRSHDRRFEKMEHEVERLKGGE